MVERLKSGGVASVGVHEVMALSWVQVCPVIAFILIVEVEMNKASS